MRSLLLLVLAALPLGACVQLPHVATTHAPFLPSGTPIHAQLAALPAAAVPVTVAVYGFADQTGQYKPVEGGQSLSRAVSQGGASVLMKALGDVAGGGWFTVLEREQLKDLLTERQIVSEMRGKYLGEEHVDPKVLPSMLYAGVLLEGGIVSYDTDTLTGGAGANLLGIGADVKYRQDQVTVYLRAVSVKTGAVLVSVQVSKTIASQALQGSAFRYIALKELLQAEGGVTTNEPGQLVLQQAIEKAVYALVMEGAERKLWSFADPAAGQAAQAAYRDERDGTALAAAPPAAAPSPRG